MSNGCANYADALVKRFCRTFCRRHWFWHFHWKSKLQTTFSVRAHVTSLHKNLAHPTWPHFYEKNAVNTVIWRTFANYARALAKLFCRTFRGAFFYFGALFFEENTNFLGGIPSHSVKVCHFLQKFQSKNIFFVNVTHFYNYFVALLQITPTHLPNYFVALFGVRFFILPPLFSTWKLRGCTWKTLLT
jgi:hypothetical protein